MRIGVQLPHTGPHASAAGIVAAARAAEAAGIASLSVVDRVLWPLARAETLPAHQATTFDPIESLTLAAAVTERIELMTAILAVLYQPPAVLARRLATLDQISGGRFVLGAGQGALPEEFESVGVPMKRRGAGYDEHIAAMRAAWGPDPVSFSGRFYRIAESNFNPKPARPGGPPVLVGATSEAAIRRAARWADGLLPAMGATSTWEELLGVLDVFRKATGETGRGPLEIRLRAHTIVTDTPLGSDRIPVSGTVEQIIEDLLRLEELGVDEVCINQTQKGVPFAEQLAAAVAVQDALARV